MHRPIYGNARPARILSHLVALLLVAGSALVCADRGVPDPLSLEQALSFAAGHPRTKVGANTQGLPRRQPLYLGCHALAFTGTRDKDETRDVAWSPLLAPEAAQRLTIMQRFYDVLLADLSYGRDNEAMAVAYVQFDRAQVRAALGQFSPLKVAQLAADYQLIRRQRAASEAGQRVTRALLAQALGRPEELPRELVKQEFGAKDTPPPELDAVIAAALEDNPRVQQLMADRGEAARALITMEVRQQAMELLTRLQLLDVIAEQAKTESDWRDLKLDESRTLYELEARADLGFSMSQQTKARRDEEQVALCQTLTRAELEALQGKPTP
ncbi:MAG: hypothetical protein WBG92_13920 [Thiohalocapsa sp.]